MTASKPIVFLKFAKHVILGMGLLTVPLNSSVYSQQSSGLLRDAETEGLLRLYARPIFRAAGLNPAAIKVYIIGDRNINAFVAGGQRIFVHTGLFTKTKTPNEVIGVLAHETGHIAGGHLARLDVELSRASKERIIGMLIGAAAVVGGAASGSTAGAKVGQGILMGTQGSSTRGLLAYQRSMEATADQSALKYLKATKQSPKGMITTFESLARDSLAATRNADPYLFSHPMPLERIRNLEVEASGSEYFNKLDSPALQLRHDLVKAKIVGFLERPQIVFERFPKSNTSLPARYARAIAMFRRGDIKNAVPVIDSLTADLPENPYFWELKGQALLENGNGAAAVAPLKRAISLLPNNGLIQILYAQALLAKGDKSSAKEAIVVLNKAARTETDYPPLQKILAQAYAAAGDLPRAELATAEFAFRVGDRELAIEKAKRAQSYFSKGSSEWLRANDIMTFSLRKKK